MNLFDGLQVNIFQSYSEMHSSDKNALKLSKNAQKKGLDFVKSNQ